MNHKKTLIALAVILMAIVPASMIMSDGSDAKVDFDGEIWGEGFTTNGGGTLNVVLKSDEYEDQVIEIVVTEGDRELGRTTVTVPADGSITAKINFRLDGAGTHYLRVTCEPADLFPGPGGVPINYRDNVEVNVSVSIWSNTTTYIAIIVVAILIVIAVYLRIRSAPAKKPKMTFTELERQKAAEKGEVTEQPKASATERRRYNSSESGKDASAKTTAKPTAKTEPKPEPKAEEAKPTSFTELDRQKKEAAKSKGSSEEPKKLKYVSSRRK